MKVIFEQSGGFAGLIKGCELDEASLSPEARAGLEQIQPLQEPAGKSVSCATQTRDAFQYSITVEDGGKKRTYSFGGSAVPQALQPLVRELQKCSRALPLK